MTKSKGTSKERASWESSTDRGMNAQSSTTGSATGGNGGSASKSGGDGQAQEVAGQVQEQASKLVGDVRKQATGQIATQQERAASTLGLLAEALHETGRQVREQDNGMFAQYVDVGADQLDRLAVALREQDLLELIDSAGRFGRRQPALFLAASFAIGFAGTRFLRSSGQGQSRSSWSGESWSPSTSGSLYDQPVGSSYGSGNRPRGRGDLGYGTGVGSDSAGMADTMIGSEWSAGSQMEREGL
jgi:hypothetical protein